MMATYYPGGSEVQAAESNLQTLYLMNPTFSGYPSSDTQNQPQNMLLLNPPPQPHALNPSSFPHAPPLPPTHQQHLVGIPLVQPQPPIGLSSTSSSTPQDYPSRPFSSAAATLHEIPAAAAALHGLVPRVHYNLWSAAPVDPSNAPIPTAIAVTAGGGGSDVAVSSSMGCRRSPMAATAVTTQPQQQQQQGLSLSLNDSPNNNKSVVVPVSSHQQAGGVAARGLGDVGLVGSPAAASTSGVTNIGGVRGVILGSKYLKAAQELLDEVVNVEKAMMKGDPSDQKAKTAVLGRGEGLSGGVGGGGSGENSGRRSGGGGANELTTAQRQELQMKKAKLLSMLDEVDQRYQQYHSQMQMVVASFEQVAGIGSAKSYTALALQTISKQFRCLKDAIASQIKATSNSLGEDDRVDGRGHGGSTRIRFVDYQLGQRRALQQLGMLQHNAWRPQRGLPERAVSVLRAWLFEHFLHPYPKDSDKHMLAKQTGLTRSQVSNWFINARVRLWKPMVEEMYMEELKSQEQNGSEDPSTATTNNNMDSTIKPSTSLHPRQQQLEKSTHVPLALPTTTNAAAASNLSNSTAMSPPSASAPGPTLHHTDGTLHGFSLIRSTEMDSIVIQRRPKRPRSTDIQTSSPNSIISSMEMEMKPRALEPISNLFNGPTAPNQVSGFGGYPLGDIESRFDPDQQLAAHGRYLRGNGVSLTLGLPHCESLSLSGTPHHHHQHHNFISTQNMQLGRRLDMEVGSTADFCGITTSQPSHSGGAGGGGYNGIDLQSRKRFAAAAQLLPDFVT